MIYLENITEPQEVTLLTGGFKGDFIFTLRSTVNLDTVGVAVSGVTRRDSGWTEFSVTLPEGMTPGSYEYTVSDTEGHTIVEGCARIGEYGGTVKQYLKDETYTQYE